MCERSKRGLNPSLSLPIVLRQLPQWIEDYNEVHPHRGLRMHSPREYRSLNEPGGGPKKLTRWKDWCPVATRGFSGSTSEPLTARKNQNLRVRRGVSVAHLQQLRAKSAPELVIPPVLPRTKSRPTPAGLSATIHIKQTLPHLRKA
jgi:hypothetical protein